MATGPFHLLSCRGDKRWPGSAAKTQAITAVWPAAAQAPSASPPCSVEPAGSHPGSAANLPHRGDLFTVLRVKPPADRRDFSRTHRDGATPRKIRFSEAGIALREPQPRRISRYSRSKREVSARNQTA